MKKILLWLFVFSVFTVSAQDTLTVLQYNLLNYGNYTSYCTRSNNNYLTKDGYIHTIVNYIKPDIFAVEEMSPSPAIQKHLLNYALNTGGVTTYKMANFIRHNTYAYTMPMLYYNSKKLGLAGHTIAQDYIRDIEVYKLYYKSTSLNQGDTVFLYCVVAHLKASSGAENVKKRYIMAKKTMNYLESHVPDDNTLLLGDFNVYNSNEPAFQEFINYSDPNIRFNDPINEIGWWHNNPAYKLYQTQSTHTSGSCPSTGGMDDRFDFILISNDIKNDTKKVEYIPDTYHAVGQDGKHFNMAINSPPTNTSVPSNVLNALYQNSDHLPVTMKLLVNEPLGINPWRDTNFDNVSFANPVGNNLEFTIDANKKTPLTVEIFSILGQRSLMKHFLPGPGQSRFNINVSDLPKGMYIIRFTDESRHFRFTRKLLKK